MVAEKSQSQNQRQDIKFSKETSCVYCTYFTDDSVRRIELRANHGGIEQVMKNAETLRKIKQVSVITDGQGLIKKICCHLLLSDGRCSSDKAPDSYKCHVMQNDQME